MKTPDLRLMWRCDIGIDRGGSGLNPPMTMGFTVPGKPVSVNQAYGKPGHGGAGRRGLYMTTIGKTYKAAVKAHAIVEAKQAKWPEPHEVKSVTVGIYTWNTRHDAGAAEKLTLDAMEGVVYENDRVVQTIILGKRKDNGPARVEVVVMLEDDAGREQP